MNYHRLSQGVEWAVLAAVVGLHALILVQWQGAAAWVQIAGDAQPLVAITLLVGWIVLGPGPVVVRTIVVVLLGCAFVPATSPATSWLNLFLAGQRPSSLALVMTALAAVAVVRLFGLRVNGTFANHPEPRTQFSIRGLLVTTTLIGVGIGCLEMLRRHILVMPTGMIDVDSGLLNQDSSYTWRTSILSVAIVGSALGGLAAVLRPGLAWLRLAILCVALPTLAAYLTHLAGTSNESFVENAANMAVGFVAVATLTAISVLPLRLMGFRLCRAASKKCGSTVPAELDAAIDVGSQIVSNRDGRTTLEKALP